MLTPLFLTLFTTRTFLNSFSCSLHSQWSMFHSRTSNVCSRIKCLYSLLKCVCWSKCLFVLQTWGQEKNMKVRWSFSSFLWDYADGKWALICCDIFCEVKRECLIDCFSIAVASVLFFNVFVWHRVWTPIVTGHVFTVKSNLSVRLCLLSHCTYLSSR